MKYRYLTCLAILVLIGVGTVAVAAESPQEPPTTLAHLSVNPNGLSYVPEDVLIGQDETVYLLSRENLGVFRWSVSQRGYTETVSLNQSPSFMAYSPNTNRLYLGYADRITQVRPGESLDEQSYITPTQTLQGLSTADEYVFVCTRPGTWSVYYTYDPDGALVDQEEWSEYSTEFIWNAANHRMYHLQDTFSPNDLLWKYINASGVFSDSLDSPYHDSTGIQHPIRAASDGSEVVLGSGRVYDALTLVHTHTLSNTINDAAWAGGNLFTLQALDGATQVQKWDAEYAIQASLRLDGTPVRVFPVSEGLLVITYLFDKPWFWILDLDLNIVYQSPTYHTFLPAALRNYCPDFFDDFSNPVSGWPVGDDSYVRTEYLSGKYRVLSKRDGYLYLFSAPACDRENYTVEVDARWQGTPGSSYGILFGITGNLSYYYLFDVNTDYRQFRVYRSSPSGFTLLVAPTYASAINGGTASNHLKVTRNGSQITLYANGAALGTWWDSGITGLSRMGLVSSTYVGSPTSDARFDNFSAVTLTTGGAGAQGTCEPASSHNYESVGNLEW